MARYRRQARESTGAPTPPHLRNRDVLLRKGQYFTPAALKRTRRQFLLVRLYRGSWHLSCAQSLSRGRGAVGYTRGGSWCAAGGCRRGSANAYAPWFVGGLMKVLCNLWPCARYTTRSHLCAHFESVVLHAVRLIGCITCITSSPSRAPPPAGARRVARIGSAPEGKPGGALERLNGGTGDKLGAVSGQGTAPKPQESPEAAW